MSAEHGPTVQVVAVVRALTERVGWATTAELGELAGVHRDTARRVAGELARQGWAARAERDGTEVWALGPGLVDVGMEYLRRRLQEVRAIEAEVRTTTTRLAGLVGLAGGREP